MRRAELDTLVEWAADEGWNPGRNDAQIFWDTDPQGFVAAEQGGELIGGGSIVSYDGRFGFMGLFIIYHAFRHLIVGVLIGALVLARLYRGRMVGRDYVIRATGYWFWWIAITGASTLVLVLTIS